MSTATMSMDESLLRLDEQKSKQMMRLMEMLDDQDDVQNVYTNFDIPDELLEEE